MKISHFLFTYLLMLLFTTVLLAACTSAPTSSALPSETPTSANQVISTVTLTPTSASIPTKSALVTLTPTLTPNVPKFTPKPTLGNQEKGETIRKLMNFTQDCKLPCFWGIIPGKTTWVEASGLISPLSPIFESRSKVTVLYTISSPSNTTGITKDYDNTFSFITNNQEVVETIRGEGIGIGETDSSNLPIWRNYSPQNLIRTYGEPSRIFLSSISDSVGDKGIVGYNLWLFYDSEGFMVRYNGGVAYASTYHFCPTIQAKGQIDSIYLFLIPSRGSISLDKVDKLFQADYLKIKSFKDVTQRTNYEFSQLFLQDDKPPCFDASRDIWK
jgi:hypothetical protein